MCVRVRVHTRTLAVINDYGFCKVSGISSSLRRDDTKMLDELPFLPPQLFLPLAPIQQGFS
jgi:hypothetical protein